MEDRVDTLGPHETRAHQSQQSEGNPALVLLTRIGIRLRTVMPTGTRPLNIGPPSPTVDGVGDHLIARPGLLLSFGGSCDSAGTTLTLTCTALTLGLRHRHHCDDQQ
ncbi:hypothetical protein ALI22I_24170 [Saccharothrix sp. ALI-22-I]|nr:hypothetical protein ALI22I_24170 [Saccharothrix sp. ALI-22-I]